MKKLLPVLILAILSVSAQADTDIYFSPNGGADDAIIKEIDNAKTSVDVCIYTFTRQKIADALIKAKERGIKVRVIFDKRQSSIQHSKDEYLNEKDVPVYLDGKHKIQHNKFAIVDGKVLITGSYNWTKSAEKGNAENLMVIKNDAELVKKFQENFDKHLEHSSKATKEEKKEAVCNPKDKAKPDTKDGEDKNAKLATYYWSVKSKVYHKNTCKSVPTISNKNLRSGNEKPENKRPCKICGG